MKSFKDFLSEIYSVTMGHNDDPETGDRETGSVHRIVDRRPEKTKRVPLSQIKSRFEGDSKNERGTESREHIDNISKHLRKGGTVPPILVRRHPKTGGYQVVDGHHRYFAHKNAGMKHIDVHVLPPARAREVKNPDLT